MFNTRQTVLASRPAAMVLALALVAALTVPALLLPHAHAADDPPLPCAEANHNGCTELSPTPPEDTASVPPNIVLMLDDSGSMAWDYMPDWEYLADTSRTAQNGVWDYDGVRNSAINGVYYNPARVYPPPPKADGTLYPDSPGLTNAYRDGFTNHGGVNITWYAGGGNGNSFAYYDHLKTTQWINNTQDNGPAVWGGASSGGCPSGYYLDPNDSSQCIRDSVSQQQGWKCPAGYSGPQWKGGRYQCYHFDGWDEGRAEYTWADATSYLYCPSGSSYDSSDGLCHFSPRAPIPPTPDHWTCPNGGSTNTSAPPPPSTPPECTTSGGSWRYVYVFTYVTGTPGNYVQHYVASGTDCDILSDATQKANCVNEGDTSGVAAPNTAADGATLLAQDGTPLTAGQNVANWFSYYRTRMLMAKSGLMTAFSKLDPKYRFGFASINGNGKDNIPDDPNYFSFDDASSFAGDANNRLAVVQPFGQGSDTNSQRSKFWKWIANENPSNGTPLRKALQAVGDYYKTAQPWSTMPGDPGYSAGSTTKYACRASYTILTTDGFWNGANPSGIGYAAGADGPSQSVPSGDVTQYQAVAPFSGGKADSGASLADVATYYWENDLSDMANEVAPSTSDPATWQHMTTFTIGLGFTPVGIQPSSVCQPDTDKNCASIFAWAQGGTAITGFSWPTPSSNNINNIADLAHAAVNGHGDFFNVKNPQDLADAFAMALSDIGSRNVPPSPAAVNASVLSLGAVSFSTGYSTKDWTGALEAVTLKNDGTVGSVLWMDGSDATQPTLVSQLDSAYHSSTDYANRKVYTGSYKVTSGVGTFTAFQFDVANEAKLDTSETAGLTSPAIAGGDDILDHRIDYLLGDNTYELTGLYRTRSSILGAILRSEPTYVAGATGNYYGNWPALPDGTAAPENQSGAQTYDDFIIQQSTQPSMVYVGANDGMLHAFRAPVSTCISGSIDATTGDCTSYSTPADAGTEAWAFVPRAVYDNLGNLTTAANFQFRPTVDGTPVSRDVFFSGDKKWHTILTGGVGLGGRGVYALDITDPTSFSALWEFDSDMLVSSDCVASYGDCRATDLGYTVSHPNIARLSDGKWVVLVPNGYFPDCSATDTPTNDLTNCQAIAAQAPLDSSGKPYSALFVLDAETGALIAELKTPTDVSGVTSYGLATPVLGDYNNDQIDDVAFAGDVEGNLWRFNLSDADPSNWTVTLAYKGASDADGNQGVQPITTMPRLFADPATNRFMVVFGTGKFLGVGDNSNTTTQALYGIRDQGDSATSANAYTQSDLVQQYLHETVVPAFLPDGTTPNPLAGASLRCVTGGATDTCDATSATATHAVPVNKGGWRIDLLTTASDGTTRNDAGERVVVNPGAIFASNTVVVETLITGSQNSDACNPSTAGAIMALNAVTGGPAGATSVGSWPMVGGRITSARTSGSLPVVSALGGGKGYPVGAKLEGVTGSNGQISTALPMWRRRSWQEIHQ